MKYRCTICGHIYDEEAEGVKFADLPETWVCPTCKQPKSKFVAVEENQTWAAEHVVGVAKGVSEDILEDLRANFTGECSEVGMYLAMARVAFREGYPEVGMYWQESLSGKAILKSACIMKRLPMKKLNTLPSSLNCSAK